MQFLWYYRWRKTKFTFTFSLEVFTDNAAVILPFYPLPTSHFNFVSLLTGGFLSVFLLFYWVVKLAMYYFYITPFEFFLLVLANGVRMSKYSQVSRTLLSILTDLNNAVVWMVSARPSISNTPNPLYQFLEDLYKATITTGITVTLMFDIF